MLPAGSILGWMTPKLVKIAHMRGIAQTHTGSRTVSALPVGPRNIVMNRSALRVAARVRYEEVQERRYVRHGCRLIGRREDWVLPSATKGLQVGICGDRWQEFGWLSCDFGGFFADIGAAALNKQLASCHSAHRIDKNRPIYGTIHHTLSSQPTHIGSPIVVLGE